MSTASSWTNFAPGSVSPSSKKWLNHCKKNGISSTYLTCFLLPAVLHPFLFFHIFLLFPFLLSVVSFFLTFLLLVPFQNSFLAFFFTYFYYFLPITRLSPYSSLFSGFFVLFSRFPYINSLSRFLLYLTYFFFQLPLFVSPYVYPFTPLLTYLLFFLSSLSLASTFSLFPSLSLFLLLAFHILFLTYFLII